LQLSEFSDLSFRLPNRPWITEGFSDGLAVDLVRQTRIGTMPRIVGLMAMAVGFATPAGGGSDGTRTQIAQLGNLTGDTGPSLFEGLQGLGNYHDGSLIPSVYHTLGLMPLKAICRFLHFQVAHPQIPPRTDARHRRVWLEVTAIEWVGIHSDENDEVKGRMLKISLLLAAITVVHGATLTFSNTSGILIPDPNETAIALPYPSSIIVTGVSSPVSAVSLSLFGLSHTETDDLLAVISSPSGQSVVLFDGPGGGPVFALMLTFYDAASSSLPDFDQIISGTYRAGQNQYNDLLDPPGPDGPYGSSLLEAIGPDPNGAWSLWIMDFNPSLSPSSGVVSGGWSIDFTVPDTGVPEPSSLLLGTFGLFGCLYRHLSKKIRT
jgi:hypothetical protein